MASYVEQKLASLDKRFQAALAEANALHGIHEASRGAQFENEARSTLARFLPDVYQVHDGFLRPVDGLKKQLDIVIRPRLLPELWQEVPVGLIMAAGEVKTTLGDSGRDDYLATAAKLADASAQTRRRGPLPFFALAGALKRTRGHAAWLASLVSDAATAAASAPGLWPAAFSFDERGPMSAVLVGTSTPLRAVTTDGEELSGVISIDATQMSPSAVCYLWLWACLPVNDGAPGMELGGMRDAVYRELSAVRGLAALYQPVGAGGDMRPVTASLLFTDSVPLRYLSAADAPTLEWQQENSADRSSQKEETPFLLTTDDEEFDPDLDHLLTEQERSSLDEILHELTVPPQPKQVVEIFRAASKFIGAVPPEGEADLFSYVARLGQAWASPRKVPPLLAFLIFLAARSESPDDQKLREFVRQVAGERGMKDAAFKEAETAAVAPRDVTSDPVRVVVSAEEDDACFGNYMLTACLYLSSTGVPVKKQTAVSCTVSELQHHGEQLLRQAGDWIADIDHGRIRAEFSLPMPLIDQPVDEWRVGIGEGVEIELGLRCIVLVRPSGLHRGWELSPGERWGRRDFGTLRYRVRWLHHTRATTTDSNSEDIVLAGTTRKQIFAKLKQATDVTCVALSYAYQPGYERSGQGRPNEVDGLRLALDAGIPAAIWRRDGGDVSLLRTMLDEMAERSMLSQLPGRVHELRVDAAASGSDGSRHPGQHLTLLWNLPADHQGGT